MLAVLALSSYLIIDGGDLEARQRAQHDKNVRIATVVTAHTLDLVTTEVGLALTESHETGALRSTNARLIGKTIVGITAIWALNKIAEKDPGKARKWTKIYGIFYGCIVANNLVQAKIARRK